MGIKLSRQKPKHFLASFIYRAAKIIPLCKEFKLRLFLDLEWIFEKLSHEFSFKYYSSENHPVRQYSKKFILDNIDEKFCVLDLGCGTGEISFCIADKAKKVIGVDKNEKAIKKARDKYKKLNLEFYFCEASEFLEKSNEKFDVIILSHFLEHLDDPKDFLIKYKEKFNFLYIELPDFERTFFNIYRKDLNSKLIYSDIDHISEFDRDELKKILNDCNIDIIMEEYRFGLIKLWCKNVI